MSDRLTKQQVERALKAWHDDSPDSWDPVPVHAEDMINALDELLELRRVGDEVVTQLSAERLALRARVAELEAEAARRDAGPSWVDDALRRAGFPCGGSND